MWCEYACYAYDCTLLIDWDANTNKILLKVQIYAAKNAKSYVCSKLYTMYIWEVISPFLWKKWVESIPFYLSNETSHIKFHSFFRLQLNVEMQLTHSSGMKPWILFHLVLDRTHPQTFRHRWTKKHGPLRVMLHLRNDNYVINVISNLGSCDSRLGEPTPLKFRGGGGS